MANGDIFKEIKSALEKDPDSLTFEMRDRLVLAGMIKLYEKVDNLEKRQIPLITMYRVVISTGLIFAGLLAAFLWGIFTGQIIVIFS